MKTSVTDLKYHEIDFIILIDCSDICLCGAINMKVKVNTRSTVWSTLTSFNQSHLCDVCFSLSVSACSFIGEESVAAGAPSVLTDNPTWIIDPIDGTTNFVHRYSMAEIIHEPLRNPIHTGFVLSVSPLNYFYLLIRFSLRLSFLSG